MKKTCYMCNGAATGSEHVPPRCIFPEDPEYRKNLIRVPSCDLHNSTKSKDDELVRYVVASASGVNDIALHIVEEKVMPSFERRPYMINTFMKNLTPLNVGDVDTAGFTVDLDRFNNSIESIVRGLHYSEYGRKLLGDIQVIWGAMMTSDYTDAPYIDLIDHYESIFPPMGRGDNDEVFMYDLHKSKNGSSCLCRMRFYGGIPIYATWKKSNG